MVINGDLLQGSDGRRDLLIQAQGVPIKTDFYLLSFGGCDAVLCAQWLRTLGPVLWDFAALSLSFQSNGKRFQLKGIPTSNPRVVGADQITEDMRSPC